MGAIKRETHNIDAADQILGRLLTKVAILLQGKHKPSYQPNIDNGDVVFIKNASKIKVTGTKFNDKIYYRHTNYPGGLKERLFKAVFARNPAEVLKLGIEKMLPKNRLRAKRLRRLKIDN